MTDATAARWDCDLLVIGSGAGGLSAAVTAAHLGLKVIVAEKEAQFGGTTAWSGGWMWIPCNPLAKQAGIIEAVDQPLAYLKHELGAQFDEARVLAFLENGPRMVEFFQSRTALQFIDGNAIPDFHGHSPGAATGGRSICAAPFDGRRLGNKIGALKPPLPETTLWGLGIASGAELRHFFNALRQPASFVYVARLLLRHWRDLFLYGRGMRLVNGNALIAALAASALAKGVEIRTNCPALSLTRLADRVEGAVVRTHLGTPASEVSLRARFGVVLACGGFPHDTVRKKELLTHSLPGHAPNGQAHWSAASWGNTGDGLRLGESAGGVVDQDLAQAAALAPVSLVPQKVDKATQSEAPRFTHFPHLIERAKPGLIAVTASGQRFTNEADSYYDFMQGLFRATPGGQTVQAWLVCDHNFLRRYGLGAVKPAPMPLRGMLNNGYLQRGNSLAELAQACGVNASGLENTVALYNAMAVAGLDADFAKGQTPYNHIQGDAAYAQARRLPNPCMAPLTRAPYYAVRVVPGSLGTFAGLKANASAQVLNAQGAPVNGLYAAGNDMNSVMGGHYPSGGITLGPAMTFGFVAAHHAAGRTIDG